MSKKCYKQICPDHSIHNKRYCHKVYARKMWRGFHCFLGRANKLQTVRYLQTVNLDCFLKRQPFLPNKPFCPWRRLPKLVESSASFCTKEGQDSPETQDGLQRENVRKYTVEDVQRLFQRNPKLQQAIIDKMREEYKFYEKNTMLEQTEIKKEYLLTDSDLSSLQSFRRKTPYSSRELKGQKYIYVYYKHEVEKLALKKFGNMDLIKKMKEDKERESAKLSAQVKLFFRVTKQVIWEKGGLSASSVVSFAFCVNLFIFYCKLCIYLHTGQAVALAESVHAFVDTLNQFILVLGQIVSKYPISDKFPYGLRNYLYLSSLGSGCFIFAFGCVATFVCNFLGFFFESTPILTKEILHSSLGVLIGCGLAEAGPLGFALLKYKRDAAQKNMSLLKCFQEGDDPLSKAVIVEDTASVVGTLIFAVAMTLQYHVGCVLGFPLFDKLGSLMVAVMLGYASKVLYIANAEKLIGKALPYEDDIKEDIEKYRYVNGVFDIKSIDQDENSRFKAEIELDSKEIAKFCFETEVDHEGLIKRLQNTTEKEAAKILFESFSQKFYSEIVNFIDNMEADIKKKYPDVRHIDIELSGGELPDEEKVVTGVKAEKRNGPGS